MKNLCQCSKRHSPGLEARTRLGLKTPKLHGILCESMTSPRKLELLLLPPSTQKLLYLRFVFPMSVDQQIPFSMAEPKDNGGFDGGGRGLLSLTNVDIKR